MRVSTRTKIALAGLAFRVVMAGRRLIGHGRRAQARRMGLTWRLDLDEGIDFSIYLLGAFEPATVRACTRLVKLGATVLDIGANIGAHTLPLARLVGERGHVIAFEPTRRAYEKLIANVALNPALAPRIACHQLMLSDRADAPAGALTASWPLFASAAEVDDHGGRTWSTDGARATTLDAFCAEAGIARVDFVKIDVDGHEPAILRGAEAVLRRDRPVMVLELAPYALERLGSSLAAYVGLLADLGYRLHDQASDAALPEDADRLAAMMPYDGGLNVVARPVS
jgi:FkbM family methyltransferase